MLICLGASVLALPGLVFSKKGNACAFLLLLVVNGVGVLVLAGVLALLIGRSFEVGNAHAVCVEIRVHRLGIQSRASVGAFLIDRLELVDAFAAAFLVALPVLVVGVASCAGVADHLKVVNAHTSSAVVASRLPVQAAAADAGVADVLEAVFAHAASNFVSYSIGFVCRACYAFPEIVFYIPVYTLAPTLPV